VSLTGNLEDLPLLDILQIVSFSKKTGFLSIHAADGRSAIVFREGYVVAAFASDSPRPGEAGRRLPPEDRQRRLRQRIEAALKQLIRLREGEFNFSLTDEPPTSVEGRDVGEDTLDVGINAQELLLGLARGMDEDRRDSAAALEASFAEAPALPAAGSFDEEFEPNAGAASEPVPAPVFQLPPAGPEPALPPHPLPPAPEAAPPPPAAAPGPVEARAILLVDDEEDVRLVLAEHLTRGGYQVLEAEDPDSAVKKAASLGKAGIDFVLVTDLGMPTSGGSSFHGGFELIKRLWKANLRPPVLMMTDTFNGAVQARARQMGIVNIIFKPGLSKLDPQQFAADLRAFAAKMLKDVIPRLAASARPAPTRPAPAQAAAAQAPAKEPPPTADEVTRQFEMLQARLEELRQGGEASQIASLVMKAARDFFERGLLFVVKGEELRGVGGFGRAPRGASLMVVAREVVIPLGEPSVFLDVVTTRKPFLGELPAGRWSQHLVGKVGRFRSTAGALLPLLTNREVVAVLYGDNPETGREPTRLEPLAVFINQAGIALENAFLQRKVSALQGRE
jgi:CheY-like chemotaxis protein